jgi:hypothetical protein
LSHEGEDPTESFCVSIEVQGDLHLQDETLCLGEEGTVQLPVAGYLEDRLELLHEGGDVAQRVFGLGTKRPL